jgi:hypothetical protein
MRYHYGFEAARGDQLSSAASETPVTAEVAAESRSGPAAAIAEDRASKKIEIPAAIAEDLTAVPRDSVEAPGETLLTSGPSPMPAKAMPSTPSSPPAPSAHSAAQSQSITGARQTSQGIEFQVATRINGKDAGFLPLVVRGADANHPNEVAENISMRLSDLIGILGARMDKNQFAKLASSPHAQEYVTLNDLRSAGISANFDDGDRLILRAL